MAEQSKVVSLGAGKAYLKLSTGKVLAVADLTEMSIDRSWTVKTLDGGDKLAPIDVALTDKKITIKAKCNSADGEFLGALVGGTVTTGGETDADETVTLGGAVHTFVTTHSAASPKDLGVILANGKRGTPVSATPAVGEYVFSAGTWTFHTDEAGIVHCLCAYTDATMFTVTEGSGTVGDPTYIEVRQHVTYKTKKKGMLFPKVMVSKVSTASKSKEHATYDVDMEVYLDESVSPSVYAQSFWSV